MNWHRPANPPSCPDPGIATILTASGQFWVWYSTAWWGVNRARKTMAAQAAQDTSICRDLTMARRCSVVSSVISRRM